MSKTLHGIVEIELDGETFVLAPTLAAVRAIESRFGGLSGASKALQELSVDACAGVVISGANLGGKAAEAVAEKVWKTGVFDVSITLSKYLSALYNPSGSGLGNDQGAAESTS